MHRNSHAPLLHNPAPALPPLVGRDLAARVPVFQASGTPLAYMWPPGHSAEPYLGAAHGLVGILYALLLLQQSAPQCMPNAAADLADVRAALGCVTMLLAWRGVAWRASASACCLQLFTLHDAAWFGCCWPRLTWKGRGSCSGSAC